MSVRRARVLTVVSVLLGGLLGLVGPGAPPATASASLDATWSNETVRVPGTDLLAVAAGQSGVLITTTAPVEQGLVPDVSGVRSVTATPDGAVWAAAPDRHEVVRLDPRTRTVTGRWTMPSGVCPGSIAVTGRWAVVGSTCFTYAYDDSSGDPGLAVLDTLTGQVTFTHAYFAPMVSAGAALPGRVVAIDQGYYSTALRVYDVTSGTPRMVAQRYFDVAKVWDLQVSPDGSMVALADMETAAALVYRTADLAPVAVKEVAGLGSPRAVAWVDDARLVVGLNDVHDRYAGAVFDLAGAAPRALLRWTPGETRFVGERSLAVTSDGRRAVLGSTEFFSSVRRLESYGLLPSSLGVTTSGTPVVGQPYRVEAAVTLEGDPGPEGTTVTLRRALQYSSYEPEVVASATVGSDGRAVLTTVPQEAGWTVYTVDWGGTATHVAARAEVLRHVERAPASLTMSFQRGKTTGKSVSGTLVLQVSPLLDTRTVAVEARTSSGTRSLGDLAFDSTGTARIAQTVSSPTTYVATFYGGLRQQDATATLYVSR